MKGAGRWWLAVAIVVIAVLGASAANRVGPAEPAAATAGSAVSSTWLCPHGGGPGWTSTIAIANPGDERVDARVTSYGQGQPGDAADVEVPAHGEVLREVSASARGASTRVDIFGGWAAVGWAVRTSGKGSGLGAEPCASAPGASWSVVDGATTQRTHSFVVVMNPFTVDAVIDVALFLAQRPPVRSGAWTDLPVEAGTSIALDLGAKESGALGESIVGAQIVATTGRIAGSSLVVGVGGGIRSVLAAPAGAGRWILPVTAGSGDGTVSLLVPGETPVHVQATQLSADARAPVPGALQDVRQAAASTLSADITTSGPSAMLIDVTEGDAVIAGLREAGRGSDEAAIGGAADPATAWVVLPTAFGIEPKPSLVLVNDGAQPVVATLTLLHQGGGSLGDTMEVTVPAGKTLGVEGRRFLGRDHTAAVLVSADAPVVALGAGTAGARDTARYAMAMGVPIPAGVLPTAP